MTTFPTVAPYMRFKAILGFDHKTAKQLSESGFDVGWLDVSRYDQIPIKDINDSNENGAVR